MLAPTEKEFSKWGFKGQDKKSWCSLPNSEGGSGGVFARCDISPWTRKCVPAKRLNSSKSCASTVSRTDMRPLSSHSSGALTDHRSERRPLRAFFQKHAAPGRMQAPGLQVGIATLHTGNEADFAIDDRPVPSWILGISQNRHFVAVLEAQLVGVARLEPASTC